MGFLLFYALILVRLRQLLLGSRRDDHLFALDAVARCRRYFRIVNQPQRHPATGVGRRTRHLADDARRSD